MWIVNYIIDRVPEFTLERKRNICDIFNLTDEDQCYQVCVTLSCFITPTSAEGVIFLHCLTLCLHNINAHVNAEHIVGKPGREVPIK